MASNSHEKVTATEALLLFFIWLMLLLFGAHFSNTFPFMILFIGAAAFPAISLYSDLKKNNFKLSPKGTTVSSDIKAISGLFSVLLLLLGLLFAVADSWVVAIFIGMAALVLYPYKFRFPITVRPRVLFKLSIFITFIGLSLIQVSPNAYSTQTTRYSSCEQRGIAYFKEIGSYPKLSDGRNAKDVVKARCRRTKTAF